MNTSSHTIAIVDQLGLLLLRLLVDQALLTLIPKLGYLGKYIQKVLYLSFYLYIYIYLSIYLFTYYRRLSIHCLYLSYYHLVAVMILSGYLFNKYGRDFPLCLDATVCFEQNYEDSGMTTFPLFTISPYSLTIYLLLLLLDGDSASTAEIYALLSSIARIPIRQDVAGNQLMNQLSLHFPSNTIHSNNQ